MKVTSVVCDLCGGSEDLMEGMDWEWDSQTGVLDVCGPCRAQVLAQIRPAPPASRAPRPTKKATASKTTEVAVIREWANAHGYKVPPRGRIPEKVRVAYNNRDKKTKSAFAK